METAVNRDHSGEILLRVSPESGRFIVYKIRNQAVEELAEMYALTAGLQR